MIKRHIINTKILKEQQIKFIIESFKIKKVSKCRNFVIIENNVFDIKHKRFIGENSLITESIAWNDISLLTEAGYSTWWANLGQNLVSVSSIVSNVLVPGSGMAIEFVNGLIYMLRGYYTVSDSDLQNSLYLNGAITMGFTLLGAGFGGGFSAILKTMVSSGKLAAPVMLKALTWLLPKIGLLFKKILNFLTRGLSNRLIRMIARFIPSLAKGAKNLKGKAFDKHIIDAVSKGIVNIQTSLTAYINKLLAKGGEEAAKTAILKLSAKKGFGRFFTTSGAARFTIGGVGVAANKGRALLYKMGMKEGDKITIKGVKYAIEMPATGSMVTLVPVSATNKPIINISYTYLVTAVLKSNTFKKYTAKVFGNPSANALGARFLGGFIFGGDGSIQDVNVETMPEVDIDFSSENLNIDAAGLNVADYQGDAGSYTTESPVTAVQNALESLGLSVGVHGADGKYGPDTKNAINKFQKNVGIPVTSNIDGTTVVTMAATMVAKGMQDEAKELINTAVDESEVENEATAILNGGGNNVMKSSKLMTLAKGGTNVSKTEPKKGFMDKFF